jgi:hypothetical protein
MRGTDGMGIDEALAHVRALKPTLDMIDVRAVDVLADTVERLRAIEARAQFIVDNPAPHAPADAAIRKSMRYVLRGEN